MPETPLTTFVHPHSVYRLEYPAHWEQITQKDGESCGFGPRDRDNVGLWVSIMPVSLDTDRFADELPRLMQEALPKFEATNVRRDSSLRHAGMVADMTKEGQGGHYWIVAGGDVVLFASSQVPAGERDIWNPAFQQLMASLQITRDEELLERKLANEVLDQLRKCHPEQDFAFDDGGRIRGRDQAIYLGNLSRDVRSSPRRRDQLIKTFVENVSNPDSADIGYEQWDDIHQCIVPVLKPRNHIDPDGPTQHLHVNEWLSDVIICYAIKSKRMFRFVTDWDLGRWGKDAATLHQRAVANLTALPWPRNLFGARTKDSGRIIIVETDDNMASSRLLHPELHPLFSTALGSPFCAGIPCRDRLVLFSDRRAMKQRIGRRLAKDHGTSSYPITPKPFLVTRDGVALATTK
jgi:hypothetical protein